MFHMAAYSESVDQAVLQAIAGVADPVLTVNGDNIQVPTALPYLGLAYANGVNIVRAQMQSPALRRTLNPEISPVAVTAAPAITLGMVDMMLNPIPLDGGEQLQGWANEDGAGATRMNIFINFVEKGVSPVLEPIFSLRATGAQALTAFAWTNAAIVLDQVLPVGQYALVGARALSTTLLAFRFVFQNQTPRPGGIGNQVASVGNFPGQRMGGWGVWGVFDNFTIPTVDFFAGAADAAETLELDLVKVG